jgi:hypothetical protein
VGTGDGLKPRAAEGRGKAKVRLEYWKAVQDDGMIEKEGGGCRCYL